MPRLSVNRLGDHLGETEEGSGREDTVKQKRGLETGVKPLHTSETDQLQTLHCLYSGL